MKALTDYKIILRPDDKGTFVAYVPAIKGCHAWGKNPEEARSRFKLDNREKQDN
ncbi:MAG: type II toxin-antitoxin system HicB family antitoxin [Halothece sp. Uz-M2-17]|nr:type II toxin-antitoxin system HicB family antitoxin [Halothece sp. Uz-M2-17]